MILASVISAGAQSVPASAVAATMEANSDSIKANDSRGYSFGVNFDRFWLGARLSDSILYWHWRGGRNKCENKYMIRTRGFEYLGKKVQFEGARRHNLMFTAAACVSDL